MLPLNLGLNAAWSIGLRIETDGGRTQKGLRSVTGLASGGDDDDEQLCEVLAHRNEPARRRGSTLSNSYMCHRGGSWLQVVYIHS